MKLLQDYADDALAGDRYDFRMGHKLQEHLTQAGFAVSRVLTLPDKELSFRGPAAPEVVVAWQKPHEPKVRNPHIVFHQSLCLSARKLSP